MKQISLADSGFERAFKRTKTLRTAMFCPPPKMR